jgi:DNA (cytosine-5)-methyltransferase 1
MEEQFEGTKSGAYWVRKIRGNVRRDREHTARLMKMGWKVLRFWESDVTKDLEACADKTASLVRDDTEPYGPSAVPELTFAEFFAGIGLMRVALEKKGWRAEFANDIDPLKREMYAENFPKDEDGKFRLCDIRDLHGSDIPTVSMATASFPCNDLSLAGSRRGLAGEQSGSVWELIRILGEMGACKPPIVVLENVPGFLSSHSGEDMASVLQSLSDMDYSCDAFILNAASFVPQSRPRLFIIAGQAGDLHRHEGLTLLTESAIRPGRLLDFILAHQEVDWRLRDLPVPPASSGLKLEDVLEDLPRDAPEWWSRERAEYVRGQMSERHSAIAQAMTEGSRYSYGTVFRRVRRGRSMAELRVDGMAGCLRTPRGGSGRQILFKAGKGEYYVRLVTPRECARLMGVEEDYKMNVPLNQALFGFGDAVCVPVIEWIADFYLNPLVIDMLRGRPLIPVGDVKARDDDVGRY